MLQFGTDSAQLHSDPLCAQAWQSLFSTGGIPTGLLKVNFINNIKCKIKTNIKKAGRKEIAEFSSFGFAIICAGRRDVKTTWAAVAQQHSPGSGYLWSNQNAKTVTVLRGVRGTRNGAAPECWMSRKDTAFVINEHSAPGFGSDAPLGNAIGTPVVSTGALG